MRNYGISFIAGMGTLAILILSFGAVSPIPTNAQKWEYGQLVYGTNVNWTDESGTSKEANLFSFAKKLDPQAVNNSERGVTVVMNALGKNGWEFMYEDKGGDLYFKRRR